MPSKPYRPAEVPSANSLNDHFKLLGFKVRDVVTGFEGVAECVSFDLYGCVQYLVRPAVKTKDQANPADARWFDAKRLCATSTNTVMPVPDFTNPPGGTDKPQMSRMPAR